MALVGDPNRLDPERDRIAATLTDADLTQCLARTCCLSGRVGAGSYGGDARGGCGDRLEAALDGSDADPATEARLQAWLLAVSHALEGKALAVQWAMWWSSSIRCFARGSLVSTPTTATSSTGPEVLTAALDELLREVGSRRSPPRWVSDLLGARPVKAARDDRGRPRQTRADITS